jgi:hypothetical protein
MHDGKAHEYGHRNERREALQMGVMQQPGGAHEHVKSSADPIKCSIHVLSGLVDAPWVRTDDPESDDDDGLFAALQELVAYAFEESVRIEKIGGLFSGWHAVPVRSSHGILQEVQSLLQKYRSELVKQSRLLDQGGRA